MGKSLLNQIGIELNLELIIVRIIWEIQIIVLMKYKSRSLMWPTRPRLPARWSFELDFGISETIHAGCEGWKA